MGDTLKLTCEQMEGLVIEATVEYIERYEGEGGTSEDMARDAIRRLTEARELLDVCPGCDDVKGLEDLLIGIPHYTERIAESGILAFGLKDVAVFG